LTGTGRALAQQINFEIGNADGFLLAGWTSA